jgi:hypothetical protein
MSNDAEKVIPLAVLRAIAREPVLPRDPVERAAQADRIRKLMENQPLHVRRLARQLLKAYWDRAAPRTKG